MLTGGGIIICGGESKRMGRPKAWLPVGNETMLERVVRRLGEVVNPMVVVTAKGQSIPQLPTEVEIVCDQRPDAGPLEGIRVGLEALAEKVSWAFVTSCDVPSLQPGFVQAVCESLGDADVAVPVDPEYAHCLAAVYRTAIAPRISELLDQGKRRPLALYDVVRTVRIPVDTLREADSELVSLRNINTPESYEALLRQEGLESEDPVC